MLNMLNEDYQTIDNVGLLDLMIDYNLSWEAVYNIVKKAIEESVEE